MPMLAHCDFKHMIAKDNKISAAILIQPVSALHAQCGSAPSDPSASHPQPSAAADRTERGCKRDRFILFIP